MPMADQGTLLDADTENTERLSVTAAVQLSTDALLGLDYSKDEAGIITAHLIDAGLCGDTFAGLPRIRLADCAGQLE
jgi:hypothetical protein